MGGEFLVKNHKVTELVSERHCLKCWEDMVGTGMILGFLKLRKVRDEREKQWKQEERRERKSKTNKEKNPTWVRFLESGNKERKYLGRCKVRDSEKGGG